MTWGVALRLGRVSNLPTVWTNVLAAAVLGATPLDAMTLLTIAVACSLSYVGGMFLNDAFDRDHDTRLRSERPIPSGQVSVAAVFAIGFALLAAGAGLVIAVARETAPAATAALGLAGTIVLYDAWHKGNPLGPALMGLCRVLVYVVTAVTLSGRLPAAVGGGAVVLWAYLMGLTYVARQENLAMVRNLWPLVLLAAPFLAGFPLLVAGPFEGLLYVGFLAWVVASLSHLGWHGRLDIPRAVVGLIAGISLLDATLIASRGRLGLACVAVLGFVLTRTLQRFIPGT